jgi:FG-GAP-like repeat/Dockerin type I domain
MPFRSWPQNLRSARTPGRGRCHRGRPDSLRAATHRLNLEVLEDRRMLSFTPVASFAAGAPLATGDFNNDGQFDLVTSNYSGSVSVHLGNGDGTFQPAQTSATGPSTVSVAVGDFNADGNLDLATADYDYYGTRFNDISILLGHGDGTFAPAVHVSNGTSLPSQSIAAADLNNDGKPDLVVLADYVDDFGGYLVPGMVSVLIGQSGGDFAPAVTYQTPLSETVLALGDFDNDGNLDVAVAGGITPVHILLGNGDGTLQQSNIWYHTIGAHSVVVGDFDADGNLDLVMPWHNSDGNGFKILLGKGNGTFHAAQSINPGGVPLTAADVSGDGVLDLVATSAGGVSVALGNGDGSFAPPIFTATESSSYYFVVADFNGDLRPDVALGVSALLNDGDWSSLPPVVGDLNGDGAVNIFDVNVVSAHWGEPGPAGDANGDGIVDIFDVNLISANWTPIAAPTESGSSSNAVGARSGGALRVANSTSQPTSARLSNQRSRAITSRIDKRPVGTVWLHTDHAARAWSRPSSLDALDAVLALENFARFDIASWKGRN